MEGVDGGVLALLIAVAQAGLPALALQAGTQHGLVDGGNDDAGRAGVVHPGVKGAGLVSRVVVEDLLIRQLLPAGAGGSGGCAAGSVLIGSLAAVRGVLSAAGGKGQGHGKDQQQGQHSLFHRKTSVFLLFSHGFSLVSPYAQPPAVNAGSLIRGRPRNQPLMQ